MSASLIFRAREAASARRDNDPDAAELLEQLASALEPQPDYRRPLTKVQKEILDFVSGYIDREGVAPTLSEIGRAQGSISQGTVHQHLSNLETLGYIRREHNRSRAITIIGPVRS